MTSKSFLKETLIKEEGVKKFVEALEASQEAGKNSQPPSLAVKEIGPDAIRDLWPEKAQVFEAKALEQGLESLAKDQLLDGEKALARLKKKYACTANDEPEPQEDRI
ncbi:hypothetical protein [Peptococcus simiae]|uniref:hypothetical protein n=1 Tax=Peptococcus simiae TaxID=1643805 RepID=UPI003981570F